MHGFGVFVSGDEFEGVENVFLCFARDAEGLRAAEADADEDGVVIAFEILDGHIVANGNAAAEFYVGGTDEFVAMQVAARPENQDKLIVTIIPSYGERYLSTALFAGLTD